MDFHLLVILSCFLVAGTAQDCDGGNHGIPCCPHYVSGDMSGGNELHIKFSPRTEVGCQNSCKVQHPSSIGVTQNNAGTSCYCEFGSPRLIDTSSYWKTCLFSTEISDTTTTTPATTSATSTTTNIIDDTTITSTPTTAAASTSPTEKRSSAGSPNNFLDAFYAQWTCNEKDELFNEYEMTSLIFKETLKIFIKMTEGNKLSDCYTNDVTRSTSNGPQVMYLYTSRNHMCNNTQHILTTFTTSHTQSSSNSVSCLLHHPTKITSTAFVATAVCANIYDKIDLSPAIASVTCLGDDGSNCPFGYTPKSGDVPGWGSLEGKIQVKSRLECARLCNQKQKCLSFEHSDTSKICNLNKEINPTSGNYKDQQFCSKQGCDGGDHGMPCCPEFVTGDMEGGPEEEIAFYPKTHAVCQSSCKVLHPTSIGMTLTPDESKCYCEFGPAYLNGADTSFKTCLFSTANPARCPAGWTNLATGCYKLTNVGTHQQAIDDCKKDGGYLVEIDSREENSALSPYYKNVNAWLGATDIEKEGEWVWSHSGRKVSFTNWQGGEPNGRTRENCLRFTLYKNGNWNDAACGEKTKGVCELDTEI